MTSATSRHHKKPAKSLASSKHKKATTAFVERKKSKKTRRFFRKGYFVYKAFGWNNLYQHIFSKYLYGKKYLSNRDVTDRPLEKNRRSKISVSAEKILTFSGNEIGNGNRERKLDNFAEVVRKGRVYFHSKVLCLNACSLLLTCCLFTCNWYFIGCTLMTFIVGSWF